MSDQLIDTIAGNVGRVDCGDWCSKQCCLCKDAAERILAAIREGHHIVAKMTKDEPVVAQEFTDDGDEYQVARWTTAIAHVSIADGETLIFLRTKGNPNTADELRELAGAIASAAEWMGQ